MPARAAKPRQREASVCPAHRDTAL